MDCPACQTSNPPGQKYCGTCGHKLETACAQCSAPNPPHYKFCGQCGASLATAGSMVLARSGLIIRADQKALDLLGCRNSEMQGKPFSLFVDRPDLVIFFSHWNDLLSSSEKQSFEIALKHREDKSIYVLLECSVDNSSSGNSNEFLLSLNEVTESRLVSARMQYQQELLGLIFAAVDHISTVSKKHLDQSIEDALKKICLFAKADRCFIYGINRRRKRLEPAHQWCQPSSSPPGDSAKSKGVPLAMIKRAIVRLRRDQAYVVSNVAKLAPSERYELLAWHQADLGAVMCHLIYSGKRPIGVIGVAKKTVNGEWALDCVALVKFFGQFVSDKLLFAALENDAADHPPMPHERPVTPKKVSQSEPPGKVIDITEKRPLPHEASRVKPANSTDRQPMTRPRALPDTSRPMRFEKLSGRHATDQQPVFPRDDGLVLLTCPRCGLQESMSVNQFDRLGNAIRVNCPCRKHFAAVLEKRHSYRKSVELDGYFTLKGDMEQTDADGSIWGPMVVKDLSKAGLRFSSERADLVHCGDLLMVRFNLDNSNKALIHKPARVISATGNEVGCRFEGADSYDITLGFYFI